MIQVPFKEGLFTEVDGKPSLVGCCCQSCGQIFFPLRTFCLNCLGSDIQPINLSRRGKLYTFTTIYLPSEHFQPPYAVGWIELPEGLRVFSQIRGWQEQPLKIGMDMQLYIEKLWQDGEKEVLGYVFKPAEVAAGSR
jgi:uncharacterized OB-fold protein